jgi:hypothetical protein
MVIDVVGFNGSYSASKALTITINYAIVQDNIDSADGSYYPAEMSRWACRHAASRIGGNTKRLDCASLDNVAAAEGAKAVG